MRVRRAARCLTVALVALLASAACSADGGGGAGKDRNSAGASGGTSTGAGTTSETGLAATDVWIKAADAGMTAAFGILENGTDADILIVGAASPAAGQVQLHETVPGDAGAMAMRQVAAFTVPAHGSFVLEPGANHLMLMDIAKPIAPGEDVEIALRLEGGRTVTLTAPAKDFAGAAETYAGESDGAGGATHGAGGGG